MGAAMNKQEPSRQLRVRSVGTKVTAAEYAKCEKLAARARTDDGRVVQLGAAGGHRRAEVILARRKIVINLDP
jgi:hypothetical protein